MEHSDSFAVSLLIAVAVVSFAHAWTDGFVPVAASYAPDRLCPLHSSLKNTAVGKDPFAECDPSANSYYAQDIQHYPFAA